MKKTKIKSRESGKAVIKHAPYGDQSRRMTSITRKLQIRLIRRKLGIYLFSDFLLFLLASVAFFFGLEYNRFSSLSFLQDTSRTLTTDRGVNQIWYIVRDKSGAVLLEKDVTLFLIGAGITVASILLLQLISLLLGYFGENRQIRRILSPINEIALRADELSRLSFTEDKYHVLEDAIEHIRPGESQTLSFQDSDLVGVEAAINNLLVRMRDSYRQQARFVNDASHELRTPIAVIQGYANMLDRWGKEDEKILDESISAIRNEADHMNHLVEQLLFLARGDSGKTSVNLGETDLSAMMQEVY
jgi:signal transduction histidine kinase